ncbi:hypothetical protein EDC38_2336 [Marinimicrobium koreense]|uniref:Uncharacterized protein n=1 Tax=Marinimicrobium koreense TaxID=306545 RepID=A0A3N1P4R9_9GAMM|nr:hypothetical protein EDC38_2336 [Marinimicrobium koreense]
MKIQSGFMIQFSILGIVVFTTSFYAYTLVGFFTDFIYLLSFG